MKICLAISEFNPFHAGHARFLERCRETGADRVICLLSGNFTQRGELAVLEKRERAKLALAFGADAVIELPSPVATANAERFASGAVALFSGVKAEKCLCCGVETGDAPLYLRAAEFFSAEPQDYRAAIAKLLKKGLPLPKAREEALYAVDRVEFAPLLSRPNALLALEYAKACKRAGISFFCYEREGDHNEKNLPVTEKTAVSSSAVREALKAGKRAETEAVVPAECFRLLPERVYDGADALFGALLSKKKEELAVLPDCSEGLHNRIYRALFEAAGYADFLEKVKSKRYVASRIRRIAVSAFLGITENVAVQTAKKPPYLRLLGLKKGSEDVLAVLSTAKAPLLTRAKDAEILTGAAKSSYLADLRGEALFRYYYGSGRVPFFVKF